MVTSPVIADLAAPPLTAMTSPGAALGAAATRVLLERVASKDRSPYEELLPCVLEIRGTSAESRRNK
jgi:DNA-binding LacI/PurR family transcriptional regulator